MFGILRPGRAFASTTELQRYSSAYCNLCGFISSRYGFSSRLLLVHDFVTLWWLMEPQDNPQRRLRNLNCVRGGSRRVRNELTEAERFLAAISVFAAGVKIDDDAHDERTMRSRSLRRLYRRKFEQARVELEDVNFDVTSLEQLLARQREVEERCERNLAVASEVTGHCYAMIAEKLCGLMESELSVNEAFTIGESLGRSVFVADAIRDHDEDCGHAYNPLCGCCSTESGRFPQTARENAMAYLGQVMSVASRVTTGIGDVFLNRISVLGHQLFASIGVRDPSTVTLYFLCCIPCGDGAVGVDSKECSDFCAKACCCGCCCCYLIVNQ